MYSKMNKHIEVSYIHVTLNIQSEWAWTKKIAFRQIRD